MQQDMSNSMLVGLSEICHLHEKLTSGKKEQKPENKFVSHKYSPNAQASMLYLLDLMHGRCCFARGNYKHTLQIHKTIRIKQIGGN